VSQFSTPQAPSVNQNEHSGCIVYVPPTRRRRGMIPKNAAPTAHPDERPEAVRPEVVAEDSPVKR